MKNKIIILIYSFLITWIVIIVIISCKKDILQKKDPIITWENPSDIVFGTLLDSIQLNATADMPGTLIYAPTFGTKLNIGANQELKVDFIPTDIINYNSIKKTVYINVIDNTLTDIDHNTYKILTIGSQIWMAENLKTTKYNDGEEIILKTDDYYQVDNTLGEYYWYSNNYNNKAIYGALYNLYAVNSCKLCPTGWHVSTFQEWETLIYYYGGDSIAGGKLKEEGTEHWYLPNEGATNSSNFTALPGGERLMSSGFMRFFNQGYFGYWWSPYDGMPNYSPCYSISFQDQAVRIHDNTYPFYGFSVRCVRD